MNDLEKQIEEAAERFSEFRRTNSTGYPPREWFMSGAKSDAAKEYWLQKLSEEFESKSDDSYIELIEIINNVLKSDMAKEYHTKGMYSEEEVKMMFNKLFFGHIYPDHTIHWEQEDLEEWFRNNKKK